MTEFFHQFWQDITGWAVALDFVLIVVTVGFVLHMKREAMPAIAWSLTAILLPLFGPLLFFLFGYQSVHRPLARRRRRKKAYRSMTGGAGEGGPPPEIPARWQVLARLGQHGDGFPVLGGNAVDVYHDGETAYAAMLEAIRGARHHVHIQFFIFRADDAGRRFLDALTDCTRRGVEVRFVYDSVGSYKLSSRMVRELKRAGGKVAAFLPVFNPLYRVRINLRNHRKILVADGRVGFVGGLNIGDEYLGKDPAFGYWRDTHMRLRGPAVESLQRVFLEDWDFATEEAVQGPAYYPVPETPGTTPAQIVHSGPDAELKAIRETYFAGILRARQRVWIASPYYVPDAGIRDALLLAARSGVDVRFLGLFRPDHAVAFLAARYYWADLLEAGVKVYQYARGMMHSKFVLVDGEWASVGTANMDNRSLHLNFEVNALVYDPGVVADLERAFGEDLRWSVRIDPQVYATRPFASRLAENAARLLSPIL